MEDYALFVFLRNWVLVGLYLCFKFCMFNRFILEEYVSQVEKAPHLFQSCFCAIRDSLPLAIKVMHPSFESLVVTNAPSLHASLMNIHHNTSFRFILEDDSISSTSKTCICFGSSKGAGLWLIARPSIYLFCIAFYFHFSIAFSSQFDLTFNI
jgi:hypothetical protein